MAKTIGSLLVKIAANTKDLEKGLASAERSIDRTARKLNRVGSSLTTFVTLPLAALGTASVLAASNLESMEKGLESIMGDAEAAKKEMELLRKEALKPGLSFEQALKGSVRLQAVELDAETARRAISAFGNALALVGGSSEDLDGVTLALTQIASKGKISAEEINQLAERVPQIRIALKDAFGTADTEKLQKMNIDFKQFIDGVVGSLEQLPKAESGMKNMLENMRMKLQESAQIIGKSLFPVVERLIGSFSKLADRFAALSPKQQDSIVKWGLIAAAAGPVLQILGKLTGALGSSIGIIRSVVGGVHMWAGSMAIIQQEVRATMAVHAMLGNNVSHSTVLIQRLTKAWQGLSMVTKASVIGIAIAAVAGLAIALSNANREASTAEKIQARLNDVTAQVASSISAEKVEAEALVRAIKDENTAKADKLKALKDLQTIAPEYFDGIKLEGDYTKTTTEALKSYIEALKQKATAQAVAQELAEIDMQMANVNERMQEAKPDVLASLWNVIKSGGSAIQFAGQQTETWSKNIITNRNALLEQKKALEEMLDTMGGTAGPKARKRTPEGGDKDKKKDTLEDYMARLEETKRKALQLEQVIRAVYNTMLGGFSSGSPDQLEALAIKPLDGEAFKMPPIKMALDTAEAETASARFFKVTTDQGDRWVLEQKNKFADGLSTIGKSLADRMKASFEAIEVPYIGDTKENLANLNAELQKNQDILRDKSGSKESREAAKAQIKILEKQIQLEKDKGNIALQAAKASINAIREEIKAQLALAVSKAITNALGTGPFGIILAAGAAAATVALFDKFVPKLAKGGVVSGPTMAVVGDNIGATRGNPEVVAPLKDLGGMGGQNIQLSGSFRIHREDMVLWIQDALHSYLRTSGRKIA